MDHQTSPALKPGTRVYWTSHSPRGISRKTGKVVRVVAAGNALKAKPFEEKYTPKFGAKGQRRGRSYLVAVPSTRGQKPLLYWPRTCQLKLAGGPRG